MKKIYLLLSLSIFAFNSWSQDFNRKIALGTFTVQEIQAEAEAHFAVRGTGKGTGYKQYKRWEYQALRDMDNNGYLKSPSYYFNELENYNSYLNNASQNKSALSPDVGNWTQLGPTSWNATSGWNPGVGRLTSIASATGNANHIIVGSVTGGVWKTMDGGATWNVLTDNLANLDVYALAIDPTNSQNYFWGSTGGTMFKSTDGGGTWVTLNGSIGGGKINKILIDPSNTQKMYCSIEEAGLYKSIDGGVNWDYIIPGGADDTNLFGFDFEFKPGDPTVVYASGSYVYRSINSGDTFTKITIAGSNATGDGAKMLAVTPANPSLVYVLEASGTSSAHFSNLFKSIDSGSTYTALNHAGQNYFGYELTSNNAGDATEGQAPRDMDIAISPINANEIHIAGVNTWRSLDAGVTFSPTTNWNLATSISSNIGYSHADVDLLEFIGSTLFTCTDGGLYKATNSAGALSTTYFTDLTTGMGIRQFYKFGISQTNPVVITGGSQDNGVSTRIASGVWKDWLGGDGMESFVDKNNNNTLYGALQSGSLYYSQDGGVTRNSITGPVGDATGNWITPLEQDPATANTIYAGYKHVQKSIDGGGVWTAISQDFGSKLDHLKIAPSLNTTMYAAYGSNLYKTTTGSGTWTAVAGVNGSINSIAIHPTNPNKVAVATTSASKVFVTTDGGATWTPYLFDLPDFSALALAWDNNGNDGLYLGMNYGIYYIDNMTANSWKPFKNNLPNVKISELEVNYADNKLYTGSYGRGVWVSNRFDITTLKTEQFNALNTITMYPNPASKSVNLIWDKSEVVSIRVYNSLGRLVDYVKDVSLINEYSLDVSNYSSGIYYIKINNQKGVFTKKLIRE